MKTVLILGAGRVSAPCIDYLVRKGNCKVVVADVSCIPGLHNEVLP